MNTAHAHRHAVGAPAGHRRVASSSARLSLSAKLLIAVMLIVICEGAVRKWVADGSTLPLILLRDLLSVFAIVRAVRLGHFRRLRAVTQVLLVWTCCVVGWGLLQLTLGQSSFPIYVIGLRFWLLSIWFAVAVAAGMSERDFAVTLRILMASLVLMAPLVALQQRSPPDSFINKSLSDDPRAVFLVTADVARATGTFSFTAGFVAYVSLCVPFVLGVLEARKPLPKHLLMAALVFAALVVCSLVSGSRAAYFYSGGLLAIYLLGNLLLTSARKKGRALVAAVVALCLIGATAYFFGGAIDATKERFALAAQNEDMAGRIQTVFLGEPETLAKATWLGAGVGIGSNLASSYWPTGDVLFAFGEAENGRTISEGGLLGMAYIALKLAAIVAGLVAGLRIALRTRTVFPIIVWVNVALAVMSWSAIGQLTAHALLGLMLALGLLTLRFPNMRFFG